MIPLSELFIVQPETPEEVDELLPDLKRMVLQVPGAEAWIDEYAQLIRDYPQYLTLIYHNNKPVAYIQIADNEGFESIGKDSLEFEGSVLPEYREHGLTLSIAPMVIRKAFKTTGKRKMLAKIDPDNKEAQIAIAALGFQRVEPHPDLPLPDKVIYKLKRRDALSR
ncbi:MAG: hypothetical protein K0Q50_724 [Vampirovibrio sp.]|jgi:RimJ/RimL family protein N-acetyltransferase|nr:hypothetical protein [Vampirovibrio sp.]